MYRLATTHTAGIVYAYGIRLSSVCSISRSVSRPTDGRSAKNWQVESTVECLYLRHCNRSYSRPIRITLLVESAPFFILSTSFCSLSWFTSPCASPHHSHHIRSHHLSFPRPFIPDLMNLIHKSFPP